MRTDRVTLDIELSLIPEVLHHHPIWSCGRRGLTNTLQLRLLERREGVRDGVAKVLHMTMGRLPLHRDVFHGALQVKAGLKHTDRIPDFPCSSVMLLQNVARPGEQNVRASRMMEVMV